VLSKVISQSESDFGSRRFELTVPVTRAPPFGKGVKCTAVAFMSGSELLSDKFVEHDGKNKATAVARIINFITMTKRFVEEQCDHTV